MDRARTLAFAAVIATAALPSGCASLKRLHYRETQSMRARTAWCDYEACQDCVFTCDFKDGWIVGYYDVITGGTGVPPIVPPERYWRPAEVVDNCDVGRCEWYRGFQVGAVCAGCETDSHSLRLWLPPCCQPACPSAMSQEMVAPKLGPPSPEATPDMPDEPYNPSTEPPSDVPGETPLDLPMPPFEGNPESPPNENPLEEPMDVPQSPSDEPPPIKTVMAPAEAAALDAGRTLLSDVDDTTADEPFVMPARVDQNGRASRVSSESVAPTAGTASTFRTQSARGSIRVMAPETDAPAPPLVPARFPTTRPSTTDDGEPASEPPAWPGPQGLWTPASGTAEDGQMPTQAEPVVRLVPEIEDIEQPARLDLSAMDAAPTQKKISAPVCRSASRLAALPERPRTQGRADEVGASPTTFAFRESGVPFPPSPRPLIRSEVILTAGGAPADPSDLSSGVIQLSDVNGLEESTR